MKYSSRKVIVKNLGRIDYQQAWSLQEELFNKIIKVKLANRDLTPENQESITNHLFFCEHPPVYTLGRNGKLSNLLVSQTSLQEQGVSFFVTNRGGDITYHGPGQLVVYLILDLEAFFTDIHRYLRSLEEAVIATLRDFGLDVGRVKGLTGVWLQHNSPQAAKLCAIGVRTSRWVTMHGLALNVNTDLRYFDKIVPCGIYGKKVTSMAAALGQSQDIAAVAKSLEGHLQRVFEMTLVT